MATRTRSSLMSTVASYVAKSLRRYACRCTQQANASTPGIRIMSTILSGQTQSYSREWVEQLLNFGHFESLLNKKDLVIINLANPPRMLNRIMSAIRECVEHAFDSKTMSMGGNITKKMVLERKKTW